MFSSAAKLSWYRQTHVTPEAYKSSMNHQYIPSLPSYFFWAHVDQQERAHRPSQFCWRHLASRGGGRRLVSLPAPQRSAAIWGGCLLQAKQKSILFRVLVYMPKSFGRKTTCEKLCTDSLRKGNENGAKRLWKTFLRSIGSQILKPFKTARYAISYYSTTLHYCITQNTVQYMTSHTFIHVYVRTKVKKGNQQVSGIASTIRIYCLNPSQRPS